MMLVENLLITAKGSEVRNSGVHGECLQHETPKQGADAHICGTQLE